MKLRIKTNSIRYRLTRSDIKTLAEAGYLEDSVSFGTQSLRYAVEITAANEMTATFLNTLVTLFMPKHMIEKLAGTDTVGFENTVDGLHLLAEKDFVCMDKTADDQSDNYPNPLSEKYIEEEG